MGKLTQALATSAASSCRRTTLAPSCQRAPLTIRVPSGENPAALIPPALATARVPTRDQKTSHGVTELAHYVGHRRLVGNGHMGAGVLLAFARGHQADEQSARRLSPGLVKPLVVCSARVPIAPTTRPIALYAAKLRTPGVPRSATSCVRLPRSRAAHTPGAPACPRPPPHR